MPFFFFFSYWEWYEKKKNLQSYPQVNLLICDITNPWFSSCHLVIEINTYCLPIGRSDLQVIFCSDKTNPLFEIKHFHHLLIIKEQGEKNMNYNSEGTQNLGALARRRSLILTVPSALDSTSGSHYPSSSLDNLRMIKPMPYPACMF